MLLRHVRLRIAFCCTLAVFTGVAPAVGDDKKVEHSIVVSNAPASVSPPAWPFSDEAVAFEFHLHAVAADIGPVIVTSSGIPGMILAAGNQQGTFLRITKVSRAGLLITARIGAKKLRASQGTSTAKIIIAAADEWVEVPITVSASLSSFLWAPAVWFWSIVGPAALTGLVAMMIGRWQASVQRKAEGNRAWREALIGGRTQLDEFFKDYYPNLDPAAPEWRQEIEIRLDDWFSKMPLADREELYTAFRSETSGAVARLLARLFPYWRAIILAKTEVTND